MKISDEIIEGVFVEESKGRFLCKVLIKDQICECYVPSASKLENYLNMKNKKVLLIKNKKETLRTKYSIFAVMYYGQYIMLNLFIANKMLEEYFVENYGRDKVFREKFIEDYKSDLMIVDKDTIVVAEAKGVIAARRNILFPTVYSYRALEQLNKILKLLNKGYQVHYFIISLSPIINIVSINKTKEYLDYSELLQKCLARGMILRGFRLQYEDGNVVIGKMLKIVN